MPPTIQTPVIIGVGTVFLTILGAYYFKKLRKEKIPTEWEKVGILKELYLFPLKSGKGIKTETLFCTDKGVKELEKVGNRTELMDRSFCIYNKAAKEVRTSRQLPRTVLIEIKAADNGVILSAPNKNDIYVSIPKVKNDVTVFFGKEPFTGTDCGDDVAKWISSFLTDKDEGLGLVYGDGGPFRDTLKYHDKWSQYYTNMDNRMAGIFSDLAALHLLNQASVDWTNEKLSDDKKISFLNFRPNLLVEGPKAFAEEEWRYIKIGEVVAKVCLECLRCIAPTVSPATGIMSPERQPMKLLEQFHESKGPFKKGVMGIYLKVVKTGKISQGDAVYVSKGV